MGRRRQGGGGRTSSVFERDLRRHVEESWQNNKPTTDQLVEKLRAAFPEYARQKLQPFRRRVQEIRELIKNTSTAQRVSERDCPSTSDVNDTDDDSPTPSNSPAHKRAKKMDRSEQRLLDLETQHILRKQKSVCEDHNQQSTSSSSSSSASSSASSDEEEEEEDSAVSTSEDAVYEEHIEPEFDLMKSMLRKSYSGSKNDVKPNSVEKRSVKSEVVHSKANDKAVPVKGYETKAVQLRSVKEKKLSDNVGEEKGKDGPRFRDLGGMTGVLEELKMEVIIPLYHPQLPRWLGVRPMAGILLHGPPGCGKTKLAHAIANETGVPFYKISATELVSGVSGASEENIRELFSKAYRTAPSIVFIDEIDAIASKRENLQREMERRIVTQLMTCMDESHRVAQPADTNAGSDSSDIRPGYVLVIGATNRPDAVDPALRRPGRFDREISLGVPDENSRVEILSVITQNLRLEGTFDLVKIARSTPGFVGADLAALANKAGNLAMKRIIDQRKNELSADSMDEGQLDEWWKNPWSSEEMQNLSITMADFEEAAKMVQPSSRREGFSSIPNVKWEDVGGLDLLRHEFDRYIVRRIKYPEDYKEFGVDLETGFLLYGPPGCGKTLIAKAVANEAGANFIHIKGPEILNKYVGESELAVRTIFSRARTCSPCVLFFDEVDALTTKRGKEGGWVVERLLNQLLIELDGADQRKGVYVIGATNRPEVMDRAILRPGRLGKLLYVPLPNPDERGLILKALAKKKPIDANLDLVSIGRSEACSNLSGADLAALMNEAAMAALDEKLISVESSTNGTPLTIKGSHFERALAKVSPSVSDKQKDYYRKLSESFAAA